MKRFVKYILAFVLMLSMTACSSGDSTKQTVTDNANKLLSAIKDGDYDTAVTYVAADTVVSSIGLSDMKTQFRSQMVSAIKSYTGVESIDQYAPEFVAAIDSYSDAVLKALVESYELNDDFSKSGSEATITAAVKVLDSSASYSSAYSSSFSSSQAFAQDYVKAHPDFLTECQNLMKTDQKAGYKKFYEVVLTAYFNEKLDDLVGMLGTTYADKTWTLTFEEKDNNWVVTKIDES